MSMISSLIDELRNVAEFYDGFKAANLILREAADTIWQLRDDLQRTNAENAKLRELCAELLRMAESHDPEWLHWPEMHDELRKLGVEAGQ